MPRDKKQTPLMLMMRSSGLVKSCQIIGGGVVLTWFNKRLELRGHFQSSNQPEA